MASTTNQQARIRNVLKQRAITIANAKKHYFAAIASLIAQSDQEKTQQIKQRIRT